MRRLLRRRGPHYGRRSGGRMLACVSPGPRTLEAVRPHCHSRSQSTRPMKISVACCTYNGERFLEAQLQSLIAQTRRPDEIVIVDDGSTDNSVAIAGRFRDGAPSETTVVLRRNPQNLGVVANFQATIALTTGDVIFLCDQDDLWHPGKIETMEAAFERRPALLFLFSDAKLIDAAGGMLAHTLFDALEVSARELRLVRERSGIAAWLVRNLATGATSAFRRALFEAATPFPNDWVHDEWLAILAAALGDVDYVASPLIDYRQHAANQIGVRRLSLAEKFGRLARPRGDHYRTMLRRTEVLLSRLEAFGARVPPRVLEAVREKLVHVRMRASLPGRRIARILPIAREITTGRYLRYSIGMRNIARDFLEPE